MANLRKVIASNLRVAPVKHSERVALVYAEDDYETYVLILKGQSCILGKSIYPFRSLNLIADYPPSSIRWRKNAGSWNNISVGSYPDLLTATKFVTNTINAYGTHTFDLEITLSDSSVLSKSIEVVCKIEGYSDNIIVKSGNAIKPFLGLRIAEDDTYLDSVKFSVSGFKNAREMDIERAVKAQGIHTGADNSAFLYNKNVSFKNSNIVEGVDTLQNVTDGSEGIVTSVDSEHKISVSLSGGTDNDFDNADEYKIIDGRDLTYIARLFEFKCETSNLILYSEDMTTGKTLVRVTASDDVGIAPDGATTADEVIEDTSVSTSHYIYKTLLNSSFEDNVPIAGSVFLKRASGTRNARVLIRGKHSPPHATGIYVDLSDGSLISIYSSAYLLDYKIEAYPNDWYRIHISCMSESGTREPYLNVYLLDGSTPSYTGDGSSSLYVWGMQLEPNAYFPSQYLPTDASIVTEGKGEYMMTLHATDTNTNESRYNVFVTAY